MKKNFDKGQLVGYWTIVTNIVLVVTTFWLGLVVQDFVAQKNANVSAALARAEYVKNVKPSIDSLNVNYNSLYCDIRDELTECVMTEGATQVDAVLAQAKAYITFFSRIDSIVHYYDKLIETSNDVLYYIDGDEKSGNSHTINNTNETTTDFGQLDEALKQQPLLAKIGVLYLYKEMLDFCFLGDSLNKDVVRTIDDWTELDKRLKSLYRNPKFVSIMGLTINYDQFNYVFKSEYQKIFGTNDGAKKAKAELDLVAKTFYLAIDIHKILNDNRTFIQKEVSIWKMMGEGPWGILIFGIVIVWIFFTVFVFRTRGMGSSLNQEEGIDVMRRQMDEQIAAFVEQIESMKMNLKKCENDSRQSNKEFQNNLNNIKSTINQIIESMENRKGVSEKTE